MLNLCNHPKLVKEARVELTYYLRMRVLLADRFVLGGGGYKTQKRCLRTIRDSIREAGNLLLRAFFKPQDVLDSAYLHLHAVVCSRSLFLYSNGARYELDYSYYPRDVVGRKRVDKGCSLTVRILSSPFFSV